MIVITFDFRVGPLGYFRLPSNMTLSDGDDVSCQLSPALPL